MTEPSANESPVGPPYDPYDELPPLGGTPNPRHNAEVTLSANQTSDDVRQNITVHIRITNLTGDPAEEGVRPIRIHLLSGAGQWEAVPVPGPENGTWQALEGPRWRIGTMVDVELVVHIDDYHRRIFRFDDVEVKPAEDP